jgi:hypothetical protein
MASTSKLRSDSVYWKIFNDTEAELKSHLTRVKRLVRPKVLARFAEQAGISVNEINPHDNNAIYAAVALVMRLLFPASEQAKRNLHRELKIGALPFLCAVQIARGKINSPKDYVQPGSTIIKRTAIELGALLHSVCSLALKHGYLNEEISEALELARETFDENA